MLKFFVTTNLTAKTMEESAPWDFQPDPGLLEQLRPKDQRRKLMQTVNWNVYSAVRGVARHLRVNGENPPLAVHGIVADYDRVIPETEIHNQIDQIKEAQFKPSWIERSLSNKVRLVWVFEREALVPDMAACRALLKTFADKLNIRYLLPGYDKASEGPEQIWTNGGHWTRVKETPMPWPVVFGVLCEVTEGGGDKTTDVPLDIIHEEVERRFPGRWKGPFAVDMTGVRFWDPLADNTQGCRVKPDGIQCFTGRVPFMKWDQIFEAAWCDLHRALNLGDLAGETYYDSRNYWQMRSGRWRSFAREDVVLWLKGKAKLSTKPRKGAVMSDVESVLYHIQTANLVEGAGPMINRKPGVTYLEGKRLLNTSTLEVLQPYPEPCGTDDWPFMYAWLNSMLDGNYQFHSLDYLLAWTRRFYMSFLEHKRLMGQAIFLCGPKETGKTLFCARVLKPLLGDREANPFDHLTGKTAFNDELFEVPLLAINDEEATTKMDVRNTFIARLKSFVVNPSHTYHPKYCQRVRVEWTGRIFVTLNDDTASTGLLPAVNPNTRDKMMFFGALERQGPFPGNVEDILAAELPKFARWLIDWTPPDYVLSTSRMGVESYFDPGVELKSRQQSYSYTFQELLQVWCGLSPWWDADNGNRDTWEGSMVQLTDALGNQEAMQVTTRDLTIDKVTRSVLDLIRGSTPGIEFIDGGERKIRIKKSLIMQPPERAQEQQVIE